MNFRKMRVLMLLKCDVKRLCAMTVAWMCAVGLGRVSAEGVWPQWRGPNRDGVAKSVSMPEVWPDSLKLGWKVSAGTGHASPVVVGEKVYLHSRLEGQEAASCFSLDSGRLIWQERYRAPYRMNLAARGHGKGPKSTPVFHNGKLYTLGISGILSCFEAGTGKLKWRHTFSSRFEKTSPIYGTAMSPLVADRMLIAYVGGHDQGALMAFDAETGDVKWRWDGDGPAYTSPIVAVFGGTKQVVTQTQNHCVGVALDTGRLLWSMPFTTAWDQNIVTPVVFEQTVIFSGLNKGTTAVKVTRNGDTWSTEQVWHNAEVSMYMSSPVLCDNLLFGLDHKRKGRFFCLDARTGSTLWTSGGRQGKNAALVGAGDVIFCLTTGAELIVVKQSAREFESVARYSVADSPTWAHPAVLGRQIFVKDSSTLALWRLE